MVKKSITRYLAKAVMKILLALPVVARFIDHRREIGKSIKLVNGVFKTSQMDNREPI